jgi:hypothetical protein
MASGSALKSFLLLCVLDFTKVLTQGLLFYNYSYFLIIEEVVYIYDIDCVIHMCLIHCSNRIWQKFSV